MRKFWIFIAFLVCVLVQVQLARQFALVRTIPVSFLLIAVVVVALEEDWFGGMLAGISAGLIMDIFSGGRLGVFALSYGIVGMLVGTVQALVFKEEIVARLLIVFGAAISLQVLNYQIIQLYQPPMKLMPWLYRSILPGAVVTAVVALPVFAWLNRSKDRRAWNRGRRRV